MKYILKISVSFILLLYISTTVYSDTDSPTVLITVSNRGIGLEFARQYAEKGWNVIATARKPGKAEDLKLLAKAHPKLVIEQLEFIFLQDQQGRREYRHGDPCRGFAQARYYSFSSGTGDGQYPPFRAVRCRRPGCRTPGKCRGYDRDDRKSDTGDDEQGVCL